MGNPEQDGTGPGGEQGRFGAYEDFLGGLFPKPRRENDPNRKVGRKDLYGRFNPQEPGKDGNG